MPGRRWPRPSASSTGCRSASRSGCGCGEGEPLAAHVALRRDRREQRPQLRHQPTAPSRRCRTGPSADASIWPGAGLVVDLGGVEPVAVVAGAEEGAVVEVRRPMPKPRHGSLRSSNQCSASRPMQLPTRRRISRVASSRRSMPEASGRSGSMVKRSVPGCRLGERRLERRAPSASARCRA